MTHCKSNAVLAVLMLVLIASGSLHAQEAPTEPAAEPALLTFNLSLTSNYKFRGQDQNTLGYAGAPKTGGFKPAVQGGVDYAFGSSGFYVGNWNSSVNWLAGNSVESDFYGGYKFKLAALDVDIGALAYVYAGNRAGNTTEIYGAIAYTSEWLGSLTGKYSSTVSRDYFNYAGSQGGSGLNGRNTGYLNLAYSKELLPKLSFKAAVGYTFLSSDIRSLGYKNFADANVGVSYDFGKGLALAGAVQGASHQSAYAIQYGAFGQNSFSPNKTAFIVTLTQTL